MRNNGIIPTEEIVVEIAVGQKSRKKLSFEVVRTFVPLMLGAEQISSSFVTRQGIWSQINGINHIFNTAQPLDNDKDWHFMTCYQLPVKKSYSGRDRTTVNNRSSSTTVISENHLNFVLQWPLSKNKT